MKSGTSTVCPSFAGTRRAITCLRLVISTSSPCWSKRSTFLNPYRRSRIDALVAMAMALSAGAVKEKAQVVDFSTLIA